MSNVTITSPATHDFIEEYRLEPLGTGHLDPDGAIDWATECMNRTLDEIERCGAPQYLTDNARDYMALLAEEARR